MKKFKRITALVLAASVMMTTTSFAAVKGTAKNTETETTVEETKTEEAKTEETKAEETKAEETKTEETKAEETEETKAEEETAAEEEENSAPAEEVSPFEDIDITTQTGKNILKLYNAGILAGYNENGKLVFKPEGNITRAELSRIFNGVFKYSPSAEQLAAVKDFSDNSDPAAWYYNDVRIAQVAGYINGFEDNTFRAKENFTRQQACVVIDLITGVDKYDSSLVITDEVSEWADRYVNYAVTAGLFPLEENNTFRATQNITRAEVCNLLEIFVDETEVSADETVTVDEEESTEATTQEVTVKTANGTVVKITRGGGGGGASSSSSSGNSSSGNSSSGKTETSTAASKESSTEATTASEATTKASSGGSGSSSGSTSTTTTETTTETTTNAEPARVDDPDADTLRSLESVRNSLINYVTPKCSTDAEKAVSKQISNAIGRYIGNHAYDIGSAADAAIASYRQLSDAEKSELRKLIISYANVEDLLKLQQTYFPGLI